MSACDCTAPWTHAHTQAADTHALHRNKRPMHGGAHNALVELIGAHPPRRNLVVELLLVDRSRRPKAAKNITTVPALNVRLDEANRAVWRVDGVLKPLWAFFAPHHDKRANRDAMTDDDNSVDWLASPAIASQGKAVAVDAPKERRNAHTNVEAAFAHWKTGPKLALMLGNDRGAVPLVGKLDGSLLETRAFKKSPILLNEERRLNGVGDPLCADLADVMCGGAGAAEGRDPHLDAAGLAWVAKRFLKVALEGCACLVGHCLAILGQWNAMVWQVAIGLRLNIAERLSVADEEHAKRWFVCALSPDNRLDCCKDARAGCCAGQCLEWVLVHPAKQVHCSGRPIGFCAAPGAGLCTNYFQSQLSFFPAPAAHSTALSSHLSWATFFRACCWQAGCRPSSSLSRWQCMTRL
eukprot:m.118858 g.118858  ORF g.118858 m.118858 type:complete len:409 (-) comp9535_c0_seq3:639-1865(-)